MDKVRATALSVLYEIDKNGAYMNIALEASARENKFEHRDAAFLGELVRGCVRNRLYLDRVVESYSSVKLKKISPWIMNILRLGIYQLLFMDKVPESAAVNESVKLARRYGHGASAGFVNAVLRRVSKEGAPRLNASGAEGLSVKYSYPLWMTKRLMTDFGTERAESLMIAGNEIPRVSIRTNILKETPTELASELGELCTGQNGVMLYLKSGGRIDKIKEFTDGLFTVQAEPFNMAAELLMPKRGMTVLDACAAPGGKTTNIAEIMENNGVIYAFDIFSHKLELINSSAKRLGIDIIKTALHDATEEFSDLSEGCDRVLLDVPCSGTGIIRRRPDIKWNRDENEDFSLLQRKIMESGAKTLKHGGILVYSTCSIDKRENEEVVSDFLSTHADFLPMPFEGAENGYKTWYPDIDGTDGAFICRMTRK